MPVSGAGRVALAYTCANGTCRVFNTPHTIANMTLPIAPPFFIALVFLGAAPFAESAPLANEASIEVGAAQYGYHEPNLGVALQGFQAFVAGRYALGIDANKHLVLDGRWTGGPLDYSSDTSGSNAGQPNYFLDVRGMLSLRSTAGFGFFDTYIGLGTRYLVNDAAGRFTSTGAYGYTRLSRYQYVPLGVTLHSHNNTLETNLELNVLIQGKQTSYLNNYTAQNPQNKGTGFRTSMLFKRDKWALGPYAHYWTVQDSEVDALYYEPANTTTELGVKLRYDF